MGFSCDNIQVFTGRQAGETVQALLLNTIREKARLSNLVELADAASLDAADYVVIVGPATAEPWLAVYHGITRGTDLTTLVDLPQVLSLATKNIVLTVSVESHDFNFDFYQDGKLVDQVSSEYFSLQESLAEIDDPEELAYTQEELAKLEHLKGRPEIWEKLLPEGKTLADFTAILASDDMDDVKLTHLSELLSINPDFSLGSYDYLLAMADPSEEEVRDYTFLAFRSTLPRIYQTEVKGLPALTSISSVSYHRCIAGFPLEHVLFGTSNRGGAGKGAAIKVSGDAVSKGLIELEQVMLRLIISGGVLNQRVTEESVKVQVVEDATGKAFYAEFPQLELKPGKEFVSPKDGAYLRDWQQLPGEESVTIVFVLQGKGVNQGEGDIEAEFFPLDNPEDGKARGMAHVTVTSRPTTSVVSPDISSQFMQYGLEQNRETSVSGAIVALGLEWASQSELVAQIFEKWAAAIRTYSPLVQTRPKLRYSLGGVMADLAGNNEQANPSAEATTQRGNSPSGNFSFVERLSPAEIPDDPKWKAKIANLARYLWFSAELQGEYDFSHIPPGAESYGFALNTDINPLPFKPQLPDSKVTHLSMWFDTSKASAEVVNEINQTLIKLVEELMVATRAYQAQLVHWRWYYNMPAQATPLENIYGGLGSLAGSARWCSRFVRGVARQMWLGKALQQYLPAREKLLELAELAEVGESLALNLKADKELQSLEELLAPLMPTMENVKSWLKP